MVIEIYEHDHFYKQYEDHKNNMYFIMLNDGIEEWIKENLIRYDIDYEDYYDDNPGDSVFILFGDDEDAMAFKLRWI